MAEQSNAIELRGIKKFFGDVVANDGISLSIKRGEILALLGENGSGKTTLMNMISGIYKPDAGDIFVGGKQVTIHSPEDSKALGIGMVHQHFKLVENYTAADNIWIGADGEKIFLHAERFAKIREMSERFGFEIDPEKKVCDMAVSEKQTVEILKVLYYGADILILDEPTAVLTLQETKKLFAILRRMRDSGCAIIIITHKLNEVMEISDRVTILRRGKSVGTVITSETNVSELTDLMVGRAVTLEIDHPVCEQGEALLTLDELTVRNEDGIEAVDHVSFSVHGGEIVGVAGIAGCGQKEMCEAIAGLQKIESGAVLYHGEHIEGMSPREIIHRGVSMSFIPEDRLGMGLAASLSITDNMMLKNYCDGKSPLVNRKKARQSAEQVISELEVTTPGTETPVRRLSGGNVQKVLIGREMLASPSVIITAYPVRGLDINSSYTIYNILNEQKQHGTGVLFIGEDLDVMLELCDRIVVLCHGKVTGVVKASETNKEQLGLMMTDALSTEKISEDRPAQQAVEDAPSGTFHLSMRQKIKRAASSEPFVRVAKRADLSPMRSALYYLAAVLASIVVGGIFIAFNGVNPVSYYSTMLLGCFENAIYIRGFIRIVIPLLITSLGIAIAFKMKFWNIGANGQFIMGAIFATTAAFLINGSLPQLPTLLILFLAGALGGGLFGLIPALFKVRFGTNETLLTLMLNYIAYYLLIYLKNLMFYRKLSATGAVYRPDFKQLPENAWVYQIQIGGVSIDVSLIFALALVAILFVYFRNTKQGYEISIVGDSQATARYAGMNVNHVVLRTMFLSAAIVGIAGMLHVSGSATGHTLSDGITSDVGWTGIIVAWLAKLNPIGILVTSALMGILQKGTAVAESTYNISSAVSDILQGLILFTVLAADFFTRYKLVFRKKDSSLSKGGDR